MVEDDELRCEGPRLHGELLSFRDPEWQPLINLAPEHVEDFMWMHSVELEDGSIVHAYKHWWTRRYVHLDRVGRAFAYFECDCYRQTDPLRLLDEVLADGDGLIPSRYIVRHNVLAQYRRLRWARSATRHRVSRPRVEFLLANDCVHLVEGPGTDAAQRLDPRQVFLGDDGDGVPLEVMGILLDGEVLLVIHAMAMRERYRLAYEEAKKWQK
jgi:hypothetical protein